MPLINSFYWPWAGKDCDLGHSIFNDLGHSISWKHCFCCLCWLYFNDISWLFGSEIMVMAFEDKAPLYSRGWSNGASKHKTSFSRTNLFYFDDSEIRRKSQQSSRQIVWWWFHWCRFHCQFHWQRRKSVLDIACALSRTSPIKKSCPDQRCKIWNSQIRLFLAFLADNSLAILISWWNLHISIAERQKKRRLFHCGILSPFLFLAALAALAALAKNNSFLVDQLLVSSSSIWPFYKSLDHWVLCLPFPFLSDMDFWCKKFFVYRPQFGKSQT